MTSQSEKLRSLFLSGLMVMSVIAITVSFSGGAAAVGNDTSPAYEQAIEYNSGNIEVSFKQSVEVANGDDIPLQQENFTVFVDGSEVSISSFENSPTGANAAPNGGDGSDKYVIEPDTNDLNPSQTVKVQTNTIQVDSGYSRVVTNGNAEEKDLGNRTVDVTTQNFFRSQQSPGIGNSIRVYRGAGLAAGNLGSDGNSLYVQQEGGSAVFDGSTPDNSSLAQVDTSDLDSGEAYYAQFGSSGNKYYFNVSSLNLQIEEQPTDLTDDEDLNVSVSAVRGTAPATATLYDDSDDEVTTLTENYDGQGAVDFNFSSSNLDADDSSTYYVEVVDNQTAQTVNTSDINVTSPENDEASFGQAVYSEARGDIVNMTINIEGTDEATLQLGSVGETNYNLTAQVTDDNDDGQVNLEFNTFVAGTTNGAVDTSAELLTSPNDQIDSVAENTNGVDDRDLTDERRKMLAASDYDVNVTAGHTNAVNNEDDVATVSLSERSTNGVTIWRAPANDFSNLNEGEDGEISEITALVEEGNLTQGDVVTYNDTLVAEVEASGLGGAIKYAIDSTDTVTSQQPGAGETNFDNVGNDTEALNAYSTTEGAFSSGGNVDPMLNFTIEAANPGPNSDAQYDRFAAYPNFENKSFISDAENDTHYVTLDTDQLFDTDSGSSDGAQSNLTNIGDGDEIAFNASIVENAGPVEASRGDNESVNGTFDGEDRDATLNGDEDITLETATGQDISGETNVPPGTELTVRLRSTSSNSPFLLQPNAVVQSNGSFTATADLSNRAPGVNFTLQTRLGGSQIGDEIDGTAVGADNVTTTEEPEDTATPDGTEEGTATPEDTATPEETETMDGGMTETMDGGMTETMDGGEATTTGDGGPGFTAAIALIALIAAALLAVRRDN